MLRLTGAFSSAPLVRFGYFGTPVAGRRGLGAKLGSFIKAAVRLNIAQPCTRAV